LDDEWCAASERMVRRWRGRAEFAEKRLDKQTVFAVFSE
jgi:hypothetical protein